MTRMDQGANRNLVIANGWLTRSTVEIKDRVKYKICEDINLAIFRIISESSQIIARTSVHLEDLMALHLTARVQWYNAATI